MRLPLAAGGSALVSALALAAACKATPASREIPPISARVRVIVPAIGSGWHTGMFNSTRQEPPCYQVLLFQPGPILRIALTVPIAAVTRLQVSVRDSSHRERFDPSASHLDGETWREVLPDSAQAVSRACPREPSTAD